MIYYKKRAEIFKRTESYRKIEIDYCTLVQQFNFERNQLLQELNVEIKEFLEQNSDLQANKQELIEEKISLLEDKQILLAENQEVFQKVCLFFDY